MNVESVCCSENLIEYNRNRLFFQGGKASQFKVMIPTVENIMNCKTHLKFAWCMKCINQD